MPSLSWISEILFFGGFVPALTCMFVFWIARFFPKVAPTVWGGVGLAIAVAFCGDRLDAIDYAPTSPLRPLLLSVYGAAAIAFVDRLLPSKARVPFRLFVCGFATWLLIPPFILNKIIAVNLEEAGRLVGLFAALFAAWSLLDRVAERQRGATLAYLLSALALTAAIVIENAGYTRLTLLTIILASFLGGCGVVSWRHPDRDWLRALLPGMVALLVGGAFTAQFHIGGRSANVCFLPSLVAPILIGVVGPGRIRWQCAATGLGVLVSMAILLADFMIGS